MRSASIAWLVVAAVAATVAPAIRAEDRGPVTRHSLWKIEDGRKPVYLLGSIHILHRQNYPLERPIEDAFDDARVVAFELDLDQARETLAAAMKPAASPAPSRRTSAPPAPGGKSLQSQVSPATYRSVAQYLEGFGLPGAMFDRFPAPVVAGALVQMELARLGFDPEWGVDSYFYRRARKYGKTVVPFETVAEQLDALGGLSDRGNDQLVQAALQDVARLHDTLRDIIRAWKGGEVELLARLVNGSFSDRPEIYQRVLVDRNARWVPKIETLMEGDQPALVIVGAGHLVGGDSVIAMLEAKGHVVRQQ